MKSLLLVVSCVIAFSDATVYVRRRRDAKPEYKMCVPKNLLATCETMVNAAPAGDSHISCVAARDRIHCLHLIQQREADFVPVDPEDMWVAASISDEDFQVFDEIRTKEEPAAEFRYEAVAVVHETLKINSIMDLKGLKSCHTGVGRNVGYKIPITRLRQKGLIGALNDPLLSPRENELKAFSELFSKACIVGKWSPDPDINKRLKNTYSNLCALCERPNVCDYPDIYSGYDGALRCLAHNGGQVAWTKVIYVKKFFGIAVGTSPAVPTKENVAKFRYLCPDGSLKPITENTACRWAARPWQGFITNGDLISSITDLQSKLEALTKLGMANNAAWVEPILTLNSKSVIQQVDPIAPQKYLDKANYTDVIERDYGPPKKTVRFCVVSDEEHAKCREFSKVAFSRNIRPEFECILQTSVTECLKAVRDNEADIISMDASTVELGVREFNMRPIIVEQYGDLKGLYYAVAVIRKDSSYKTFSDLRGARSCHTGFGRTAGYNAPLHNLIKLGLISKDKCPLVKSMAEFFSGGSCLPGALKPEFNPDNQNPKILCSLCVGNLDSKNSKHQSVCEVDHSESFYGYSGAFRCLATGNGDVAFVNHLTVNANTDGNNKDKWAIGLNSSDYELLCANEGRSPISNYKNCFLAKVPSHMIITSNAKNDHEIDEIRHAVIDAAQLFSKRADLFNLFGPFNNKKNLMFKDTTTGLISYEADAQTHKEYLDILKEIRSCDKTN